MTEIFSAGFPHSDIYGSIAYLQLTVAFRSLSRPSSALDAKAFSLRSFSLDLLKWFLHLGLNFFNFH